MVWKLYKQYVRPLVRVVRGLPISWGSNFATTVHRDLVHTVAWSSCSRFIAVSLCGDVEVLDPVTLERLHTFTHSLSENRWLSFSPDSCSLTHIGNIDDVFTGTTWDLQTGGRISVIPSIPDTPFSEFLSSTYSMDGKALAIAGFRSSGEPSDAVISIYNLISETHIYSHRVSEGRLIAQIWTHGEFLRFATLKSGSITIWELGFTSERALAEIESLPAPDDVGHSRERLFLPTPSRLAFILQDTVLIWDARDSKFLLNFAGDGWTSELSFSSGGRFFACRVALQVYLWKESPAGYLLHRKLASSFDDGPFLSPDGASIITSESYSTQLWRTTDLINPLYSALPQSAKQTDFILAFSPDKSFMATGELRGNIATIIDLKSGDPRLIIDTGMDICGLGVTGSTAIVVGHGRIITWNLPAGDCVLDARANIYDSVRTTVFNHPLQLSIRPHSASISPDLNHFVITRGNGRGLDIYDTSTGKHVAGATADSAFLPRFTRDGREVWDDCCGWEIIKGGGSDVIGLEPLQRGHTPSGGHFWKSSRGHYATDDGWIVDSREKQVLWLPHHWRAERRFQMCDGLFLALLYCGQLEPIIIELYE